MLDIILHTIASMRGARKWLKGQHCIVQCYLSLTILIDLSAGCIWGFLSIMFISTGRYFLRQLNSKSETIDFILKLFVSYIVITNNNAFFKLSNSLFTTYAKDLVPIFSNVVFTNGNSKNHSILVNNLTCLYGTFISWLILTIFNLLIFFSSSLRDLPIIVFKSFLTMYSVMISSSDMK